MHTILNGITVISQVNSIQKSTSTNLCYFPELTNV